MELNKIQSSGNWGKVADDLNQNFSKVNTAVEQVKNVTYKNKGYFKTLAQLQEVIPAASSGSWAFVGTSYPFQIYNWDGNAWVDSGMTGGDESLNLTDYYTKVDTDKKIEELGQSTNERFTETEAKLSELGSKWCKNHKELVGSKMANYIIDAYAEIENIAAEVFVYNMRNSNDKIYISIGAKIKNGGSTQVTASIELPLHDKYSWETVSVYLGQGKCKLSLCYISNGLPSYTTDVYFNLQKVNVIKNKYVDYDSPEFLLQFGASLPTKFIKSIYKKTEINSLSITRYRNTSEQGLYIEFLVNGISKSYSKSEYIVGEIEVELEDLTITIDTSFLGGDQYLTIPLKADVITYNNIDTEVKSVVAAEINEARSSWCVSPNSLLSSKMSGYIADAYVDVSLAVTKVGVYNLRKSDGKAYISVVLYYNNTNKTEDSASLEIPLHDEFAWEVVLYKGCKFYLCYKTDGLPSYTTDTVMLVQKVNVIKNKYVDYDSPEFLLQFGASLSAYFIKSIYKKTEITSLKLTRYRNTTTQGLYVEFSVNGVSRTFSSEYSEGEVTIDLKEFTCVLDTSFLGGDQYLTIPLKADVITYNDLETEVEAIVDRILPIHNNLKTDGLDNLPSGSSVDSSYGSNNAIYTIPLPKCKKLHLYVEYRINSELPSLNYSNMITIGTNDRIQISYKGLNCGSSGFVYQNLYFGANWGSITLNGVKHKRYLGKSSFYVKYVGDYGNSANQDIVFTMSGGVAAIKHKTDGSTIDSRTYNNSDSVYSLVNKINSMANIECVGVMTAGLTCGDIVQNVDIPLVSLLTKDSDNSTYWDAPPMYIPCTLDNSIHSVEVILDYEEKVLAAAFDGVTYVGKANGMDNARMLVLGNIGIPITFEKLHVDFDSFGDAELITNTQPNFTDQQQLISSNNPKLIIWEGHGVDDCMDEDAPITDDMASSTDRLFRVFDELKKKGYVPVTWDEIINWKLNNAKLPKRCYNIMMDDFRVSNFVNYEKRKPFNQYNVKAGLAIIEDYDKSQTMEIDGKTYTYEECTDICIRNGWKLASHAKHNRLGSIRVSELPSLLKDCAVSCDKVGITPDILIYPYGSYLNTYSALENSAFKIGVMTTIIEYNCKGSSDFYLGRYEIGTRESIDNVLMTIK